MVQHSGMDERVTNKRANVVQIDLEIVVLYWAASKQSLRSKIYDSKLCIMRSPDSCEYIAPAPCIYGSAERLHKPPRP